jgi:2-polyprenyl-3-methyl-5-hydroxy-6-metoxy-1,4-benzoquinol methylase
MSKYRESTTQSKAMWEDIAEEWDKKMGEHDNRYHRKIIRPATLKLLKPQNGDYILDAACGNGNFSRLMAEQGANVVAFDYSSKMIEYAKTRCAQYLSSIEFHVADATKYEDLRALKTDKPFNKAVSNMAIMDISDIEPLFNAVYGMLSADGIFVFSSVHPCFQTPNMRKVVETNDYTGESSVRMGITTYDYINSAMHQVTALASNSKQVLHYHRSLSTLLKLCFKAGFVLDGIEEPVFEREDNAEHFDWYEIPPSIIIRLKK